MLKINNIYSGDALEVLKEFPKNSINCCVTSPPYWGLRDYGVGGQMGLEETPEEFVEKMVEVFREVRRVLRDDGTLWLNIGDTYAASGRGGGGGSFQDSDVGTKISSKNHKRCAVQGLKPKDLVGIPWMLAFALRADGWYLRQDNIWHKPNPMPESVKDRCTKAHEYIFLLAKSEKYYYDNVSIYEKANYDGRRDTKHKGSNKYRSGKHLNNGNAQLFTLSSKGRERWIEKDGVHVRNKRSVWSINTKSYKDAHFATFPPELIVDPIKAGCPEGGIVLDPFMGAGTTAVVARKLDRNYVGIESNKNYIDIAEKRLQKELGLFT